MYSRQSQKLMNWLMSDIANFNYGNEIGTSPSEYQLYTVKKALKKDYIKMFNYKLIEKPLESFLKSLDDKDSTSIDELKESYISSIQAVFLKNNDFSTALALMTQEKANKFIEFLFNLILDNNIPLRKEIKNLMIENEHRAYIYICLKHRKCCSCGKDNADLHHYDNVNRIGGYEFDDGTKLRVMPLCRECHIKAHSISGFLEKQELKGILLKPKEVKFMKTIYKNHFKAYKGLENEKDRT